jgi:peptide/nickel transport system permease protein
LIIPVLVGVVVVVFTINYYSKIGPAVVLLGANATPEEIAAKEAELGLDKPYLVQLATYFWNLISKGSLGVSYIYRSPVWDMILSRLPISITIGLCATIFSTVIGIPLGILAAVRQNTVADYASTVFAIIMAALPPFWVCLMLMLLFSVQLGWLPISGIDTWQGYILPIIATGMMPIAMTMRMTRSSVLEVIRQDYIRTARAKGLPEHTIVLKYTLRNAMVPVITVVGMGLGISMTGSIIAETIFNIPGLGLLMNTSIATKDFITTQGCVIIAAFIVSFMNLLTDLCYAAIDPRIKAQYRRK